MNGMGFWWAGDFSCYPSVFPKPGSPVCIGVDRSRRHVKAYLQRETKEFSRMKNAKEWDEWLENIRIIRTQESDSHGANPYRKLEIGSMTELCAGTL